ncbi:MAG: hypothetical protein J6Z30_01205 [Pyramidobacter sp.]|jgi:predicted Holliday junction resolvase-like endonuclease|nr:hypothetical protein [Pyramidobacter sp.]
MRDLSELDQVLETVASRLREASTVQVRLEEELMKAKKLLEEKELDKIRALKEKDRVIEALEREKMSLQKEKEVLEGRIDEFFAKVRSLLPASGFERRQG